MAVLYWTPLSGVTLGFSTAFCWPTAARGHPSGWSAPGAGGQPGLHRADRSNGWGCTATTTNFLTSPTITTTPAAVLGGASDWELHEHPAGIAEVEALHGDLQRGGPSTAGWDRWFLMRSCPRASPLWYGEAGPSCFQPPPRVAARPWCLGDSITPGCGLFSHLAESNKRQPTPSATALDSRSVHAMLVVSPSSLSVRGWHKQHPRHPPAPVTACAGSNHLTLAAHPPAPNGGAGPARAGGPLRD